MRNPQKPNNVDVVHSLVVGADIRTQLTPASLDSDDSKVPPMIVKSVDEYMREAELRLHE